MGLKAMKDTMNYGICPPVTTTNVNAEDDKDRIRPLPPHPPPNCDHKSESNTKNSTYKRSQRGSGINETSCSCPSDAEPYATYAQLNYAHNIKRFLMSSPQ